MITQLDKAGISNYEFFDSYDGFEIDVKQLQQDKILDCDEKLREELYSDNKHHLETIGCALTHWQCWKEILRRNIEWAVVVEDDICFCHDFKERFVNLFSRCNSVEWTTIHLHSYFKKARTRADQLPSDETIHASDIYNGQYESGGTKAYVVSRSAIEHILMREHQLISGPSDYMLGSCSNPYLLDYMVGSCSSSTLPGVAVGLPPCRRSFVAQPYLVERNRAGDASWRPRVGGNSLGKGIS